MNWILFIARRYLKSKRNTEFLSLSSLLSMGGIGLGVAAIIIVLSVMSGFEKQLKQKLVSSDLHVLITPEHSFPGFESGWVPKAGMTALPALASMASSSEVELMSYQLSTEVVIRNGNKVSGILIKGVEAEKLNRIKKTVIEEALPQMLVDRDGPSAVRYPGIFVGKELAYEMGLIPGDFVTVISPSQMDGPFNNIPRIKRFVVEGIYHFGVPEQESHVAYTAINQVESFLRKKGVVSEIEIALQDSSKSASFVSRFRSELSDLKARDWNDLNANLFASMRLERLAMFLILLFTVIISSLNIVSTLTLLVQEKIKEISILKTMGATPKSIRGIFVWKGILIGGSGVFFGTLGALGICLLLKRYQFISLPDVYYDRTLPVTFDATYYLGVPLVSFFIVCLASYFPARGAAKLTPLEGIREF
ncbi:MAG: ABC transporter permease [Bdellovibrionales bacterium]|nr:ABC transporter permease [Bdellovibrionales bacterium]